MNLNLSPAEIGVIVHAIQTVFGSDSEEIVIADNLCKAVFDNLGSDFYDVWVNEFDI